MPAVRARQRGHPSGRRAARRRGRARRSRWGIVVGFVVGKPLGIAGAVWLASRIWPGEVRLALSWPVIARRRGGRGHPLHRLAADREHRVRGPAARGGQARRPGGGDPRRRWAAGRSSGSSARLPAPVRARQLSRTADEIVDLSDEVDPARDHARGAEDAPVTLVEYGDYECPYCGQAEIVIRELLSSFGDDLRYVWRHLPLNDVHANAQMAAEAAEAAAAQGAFWPMHDALLDPPGRADADGPRPLRRGARARRRALLGGRATAAGRGTRRRGRRQRRRQRRGGHAELLHQRPQAPGGVRRGDAHPRGARGADAGEGRGRRVTCVRYVS